MPIKYSNQADIVKPFRATEGKLMKKTAKFRHEKINENFINNRTACSISMTPGMTDGIFRLIRRTIHDGKRITFYLNDIIFEERGDL